MLINVHCICLIFVVCSVSKRKTTLVIVVLELIYVSKHNTIMVCIVQICYCYIFRKLFGCFFSHFLTNLYIFKKQINIDCLYR